MIELKSNMCMFINKDKEQLKGLQEDALLLLVSIYINTIKI